MLDWTNYSTVEKSNALSLYNCLIPGSLFYSVQRCHNRDKIEYEIGIGNIHIGLVQQQQKWKQTKIQFRKNIFLAHQEFMTVIYI